MRDQSTSSATAGTTFDLRSGHVRPAPEPAAVVAEWARSGRVGALAVAVGLSAFPDDHSGASDAQAVAYAVQGVSGSTPEAILSAAQEVARVTRELNALMDEYGRDLPRDLVARRRALKREWRRVWPTMYRRDRCTVVALRLIELFAAAVDAPPAVPAAAGVDPLTAPSPALVTAAFDGQPIGFRSALQDGHVPAGPPVTLLGARVQLDHLAVVAALFDYVRTGGMWEDVEDAAQAREVVAAMVLDLGLLALTGVRDEVAGIEPGTDEVVDRCRRIADDLFPALELTGRGRLRVAR